ncbi:MAG: alpha/beta fold hydrolase [Sandaracinobacteroides sp.]
MTADAKRARRWPWVVAVLLALFAATFLWLRTPDVPAGELRAKYASPASRFLELSPGFRVHMRDEGPRDAPALFLIHGSNGSLHSWEPWVARLSGRYRVITLDLQGHGLTGPIPSACYTPACMAETVEAVRAKLGIDRLAIGGNSMGGGVALTYALAHPDRIAALILVDSAGAPLKREGPPPIGFRIAQTPGLREIGALITPRSIIAETLDQSVSVKAVANAAAIDRYWELLRHPGNRAATMQRFAGYLPSTLTPADFAPLANTPVLILWGEEDALIPVSAARWFKEAMPHAQLSLYSRVGHLPQEEAPDLSARDLAAFLEPVMPGQPTATGVQSAG